MYKNILVLDDGTEISAGKVGHNAIRALTCTETVSSTTDLCPGAACASKLEITIWVEPGSALVITSGTRLAHYREDTSGTRTLCGTYWAVKPTRQTRNTYKIYAYDAVSRLDGIQSAWLRSIQGQFPMSLWAFAQAVAARCGVEIANAALPRSGDYQVQAFYADDLTGRQLLAWVAEAACTFLRATPSGRLEFAWYTERVAPGIGPTAGQAWTALSPAGELLETADGEVWTFGQEQLGYYSGGLSYEDYETAPIDKVQIRQTDDDVGVLYPADETGTNALVILGNLLLTTQTADALRPVAQAIYETMQGVTYTPLSVDIPYTADAPAPGEIITVTDAYDRQMQTYVMSRTIAGQRVTLESTGNARRDSTAAVNEQKYTNLQGKVLEISANVDGLTTTAKDLQGKQAELTLAVAGLASTVEANYDALKDYADDAANQARDEAIQSAVDQAEEALNTELELYPTKVEMNSAISQSASEISSQVSLTLEGYSTKEYTDSANRDAKSYADAAAQAALAEANRSTDGKLAQYPTKIEMNSAITQSASQITSEVSLTLEQYSTTEESEAYADQAAGAAEDAANEATDNKLQNYSTTVQMNSAIQQSANNINLQVSQTLTQYSTTAESEQYADNAANSAEEAANAATDGKLKSYSTTIEMNSAIDQKANSLILEVGQTYATKDSLSGYTKTSEVRSRFAMDPTSVTISSGRITFNSNTLVINSSNFSLDSNGAVTLRSNGSNGYVQIYNSYITFRNNSGRTLITMFPESDNVGVIRFFNGSGGFISDLKSSVQGGQGNIQLNISGSGFFDVNRARISELTCPDSKMYSDKYMALDGEVFAQMSGSYKEMLPDNLFIGKGTFCPYQGKNPMYLDWVYIDGNWVLGGFSSPH